MSATLRKKREACNKKILEERRRRIKKRLVNLPGPERPVPMMTATNIHYELADRVQGLRPVASVPSFSWLRRSV